MSRNLQLDFLRFVGVFLVLVHHLPEVTTTFFGKLIVCIQIGGWVGVDLFFVLSGYLVTGLIVKEYRTYGSFDAKRFLVRRGFKIYPSYYFLIIYQFLFSYFLTHYPQSWSGLLHEATFTANYFYSNNTHLWSISVEEHFYFLLSFLFVFLIALKKVNFKVILNIYLLLLFSGLGFRLLNYFNYTDYNFERDYTQSHYRFDGLFFGSLIAFVSYYKPYIIEKITNNKFTSFYISCSLLFLSTNFILRREAHPLISVVNLALNPICFGYLLIVLLDFNKKIFLTLIKPFSYIGMYSYSIYLFHIHFLFFCDKYLTKGTYLYYTTYLGLAIFGGILLSKCIEYPIIRYRERYFPSKSNVVKPV